ncbi:MAG: hypothetical protein U0L91_08385 [Gemmiger sp.]|uniref:hypothetical protein n=1 Tax=Gemmiger sp. TaxID=2049027 RepID=UPI002E772C40|nr:hypothetical protein [Gemmiger sp.]MEE0801278.1 hypothetical protein [Gemmiger sp.]
MNTALYNRLKRLEDRSAEGVGILSKLGTVWVAAYNGHTREFPTEAEAVAFLDRLAEVVIYDDF